MRYKLTRGIKKLYQDNSMPLIQVTSEDGARVIGVHLLNPSKYELERALESALRDAFPRVLIHDFATWGYHHGYHRARPSLKLIYGGAA